MRVFVTDGDNRASLAITRSIARAGHEVIVGEHSMPSLAQASRYCSAAVVYPNPVTESDAFLDALQRAVREHEVDVLLPVSDITTFLVTRARARFEPACAVPFAPADAVARAANKVELVESAKRLGVAVPRSVTVAHRDAVPAAGLEFPLVVKPWQSRVYTPEGWMSSSVSYVANREELAQDLASRPDYQFPVMLQERIPGTGVGVFACYQHGRPVAFFSHRRLRERPPWGGVSVLCESAPVPEVARDYAKRLLDDLGWHGVAMVEFKRDDRDGVPRLMEINGRFWGSLQLAIDAGVDFPRLLVDSTRSRIAPVESYRIGVQSRWFWGDVDSLLISLSGRGRPRDMARPSSWTTMSSFMRLWGSNLYYDNPKPYDARPWMLETSRRLRAIVRRGTSRVPAVPRGDMTSAVKKLAR